jgi:alpha/beta superfamily hydrolase
MTNEFPHEIAGPAGPLEARFDTPAGDPRAAAVFAHPHPLYGGTMHTKAVFHAAKALTRIGVVALRFNFRGVGSSAGSFDEGRGEREDFRAALGLLESRYPGLPLWAAGFSFGSWIGMTVGAEHPRVALLLGVAPVVDQYDYDSVTQSEKAKFIIHGEDDQLVSVKQVRRFYSACREPKELAVIDAADHLFDGKTSELGDAIEDLLGDYT